MFFPHIIAIDVYLIGQDNFFFGKPILSPICGFFEHFLALFDTFTTRYIDSDIKFEFSDFGLLKHLIEASILKFLKNS